MPDTRSGKKYNKILLDKCKKFNNNKSYEQFVQLISMNPLYHDRNKCKECGKELYYSNIEFIGPFQEYPTFSKGTTPYTQKIINNKVYHLCICEECMKKKFPEWESKNKSRIFNMPNKYSQYAFDIPDNILNIKNQELCARTLQSFIRKYGENEGNKRWNNYCNKQRYTNTFEYKHSKYGMTEEEFKQFNKSRACTLENFINRYGEDEGNKRWENYIKRESYTNTKEYFIETYGEILGIKKWNNFNNAKKMYLGYSRISQELFFQLCEQEIFKNHNIFFAEHGGEYEIETLSGNRYYLDFYDDDLKIAIEFNGILFHPKPTQYNASDIFKYPFTTKEFLVQDLWNKEKTRIQKLKDEYGITLFIVWEDDYKSNKNKCICDIINKVIEIKNERTI